MSIDDDWMNPPPAKGERMNKREIATCFGMTLREVQGYLDRGAADAAAIRVGTEQHEWILDSAKFWAFVIAEKVRGAIAAADDSTPAAKYASAKTRKTLAMAQAVERDNAEKAGQLVTCEQVTQVLAENRAVVSEHLLKVPGRVAGKVREARALGPVDAPAMERIIEDEINQAMEGIANDAR